MVKSWIAPFASFKLGDEEIRNTRLRIGEPGIDTDMLIGADFFLSHRIYVASKQHKLFFTYNGGAVFNLKAAMPAPASDVPPAESAPDEPKDAAAYSRRGTRSRRAVISNTRSRTLTGHANSRPTSQLFL